MLNCSYCFPLLDIDTRRRAACDLVKALTKFFEAAVIEIFSNYVQLMLQVQPLKCIIIIQNLFIKVINTDN